MSYSCSIYGLGLQYNVPIAGLRGLAKPSRIDVRMWLGFLPAELDRIRLEQCCEYYVSPLRDTDGAPTLVVRRTPGEKYFLIRYSDGTIVVVDSGGNEIWATWPDTATVEDTATYLLGPTLGFVLRLRGVTCLHASAVSIGDRAVALVGASGAGKSTMAAVFSQLGYAVLSDDVVALSDRGDHFAVQPAYPRIRLWPESVQALFGSEDALPRITPSWDKRFLELSGSYRFQTDPLPLAGIYFLDDNRSATPESRPEPVSQRTALVDLITNTYTTYLLDAPRRAQEFAHLGRLVKQIACRRLLRPDVGQIAATCRSIAADCLSLPHSSPDPLPHPVHVAAHTL